MRSQETQDNESRFTLVCRECDAGMGIESHDQAVADGWTEIDYAPDLPMANYVGLCPECRERCGHWPADY